MSNSNETPKYDEIGRPYDNYLHRSAPPEETYEVPGVNANEGARTVKTGDAFNDMWINTWIKSRGYSPKKKGFMLDSKSGMIEGEWLVVGSGIEMFGNDAYFYDSSELDAYPGGNVIGDNATLNFQRFFYSDQLFTFRKRIGVNSTSVGTADNIFEMYYPNAPQTGRKNWMFIGRRGDSTDPTTFFTNRVFNVATEWWSAGTKYGGALGVGELDLYTKDAGIETFDDNSSRFRALYISTGNAFNLGTGGGGGAFLIGNALVGYQQWWDSTGIWMNDDVFSYEAGSFDIGSATKWFKRIYIQDLFRMEGLGTSKQLLPSTITYVSGITQLGVAPYTVTPVFTTVNVWIY